MMKNVEDDRNLDGCRGAEGVADRIATLVVFEHEPGLDSIIEIPAVLDEPLETAYFVVVEAAEVNHDLVRIVEGQSIEKRCVVLELLDATCDNIAARRIDHGELSGMHRYTEMVCPDKAAYPLKVRSQYSRPGNLIHRMRTKRNDVRGDAEELDAVRDIPLKDALQSGKISACQL